MSYQFTNYDPSDDNSLSLHPINVSQNIPKLPALVPQFRPHELKKISLPSKQLSYEFGQGNQRVVSSIGEQRMVTSSLLSRSTRMSLNNHEYKHPYTNKRPKPVVVNRRIRLRQCEDNAVKPPEELIQVLLDPPPIYKRRKVASFRLQNKRFSQSLDREGYRTEAARKSSIKTPKPRSGDVNENLLVKLYRHRKNKAREKQKWICLKFAKRTLTRCKTLRVLHTPTAPDISKVIRKRLIDVSSSKLFSNLVDELLQEISDMKIRPVAQPELGKHRRKRNAWNKVFQGLQSEKSSLSEAMASFPPGVKRALASVLRPLDSVQLFTVDKSYAEGSDLTDLVAEWRASSSRGSMHLKTQWFPKAIAEIRTAAVRENLTLARKHAVINAFNNLTASKLQQVLCRSIQAAMTWLYGTSDHQWKGTCVNIYLELADSEVSFEPDVETMFRTLEDLYIELRHCVQLYRATWDDPRPPPIPQWRQQLAQKYAGRRRNNCNSGKPNESWEFQSPPVLNPKRETLVVTVDDSQWTEFLNDTRKILEATYKKSSTYLDQIETEFKDMLTGRVREELHMFLKTENDLFGYARQIENFDVYVQKASHVPLSAKVNAFRLDYKYLRQSLMSMANSYSAVLKNKLIKEHQDVVKQLKEKYSNLSFKLEEKPKNTTEMFGLMDVVEEARRSTVHVLHENVIQVLLNVVHLPEEDVLDSAEIIQWPSKLKPILEKSIESLEEYKQQFEEMLSTKSAEIGKGLSRVRMMVADLEELSETNLVHKYLKEVNKIRDRLDMVAQLIEWVNKEEALFKFSISRYPQLEELKESLVPYSELFNLVMQWQAHEKHWMGGDFRALDPQFIDGETRALSNNLDNLKNVFKNRFKQQALEGDPKKARINFDDPNPKNLPGPLCICGVTIQQLNQFRSHLSLIAVLCNKALRPRHWVKLNEIAAKDITPNAGTSLRKVVATDLSHVMAALEVVSVGASREQTIEKHLATIEQSWQHFKMERVRVNDVEIIESIDAASNLVYEQLILIRTIEKSVFVAPFAEEVKKWHNVLTEVKETLGSWQELQKSWLKLLPIYSQPDFQMNFPGESGQFEDLQNHWIDIIKEINGDMNALMWLKDKFKFIREIDEQLQKTPFLFEAREKYFFGIRRDCPRLFFFSEEEMEKLLCSKSLEEISLLTSKYFDISFSFILGDNLDDVSEQKNIKGIVLENGAKLEFRDSMPEDPKNMDTAMTWILKLQSKIVETSAETLQDLNKSNVKEGPMEVISRTYREKNVPPTLLWRTFRHWFSATLQNMSRNEPTDILISELKCNIMEILDYVKGECNLVEEEEESDDQTSITNSYKEILLMEAHLQLKIIRRIEMGSSSGKSGKMEISDNDFLRFSKSEDDVANFDGRYSNQRLACGLDCMKSSFLTFFIPFEAQIEINLNNKCSNSLVQRYLTAFQAAYRQNSSLLITVSYNDLNFQVLRAVPPSCGHKQNLLQCDDTLPADLVKRWVLGTVTGGESLVMTRIHLLREDVLCVLSQILEDLNTLKQNGGDALLVNDSLPTVKINMNYSIVMTIDNEINEHKLPLYLLNNCIKQNFEANASSDEDNCLNVLLEIAKIKLMAAGVKNSEEMVTKFAAVWKKLEELDPQVIHRRKHWQIFLKVISESTKKTNCKEDSIYNSLLKMAKESLNLKFDEEIDLEKLMEEQFGKKTPTISARDLEIEELVNDEAKSKGFLLSEDNLKISVKLFKALERNNCVAVCGQPHSGKSTIIQLVASSFVSYSPTIYKVYPADMSSEELFGTFKPSDSGCFSWVDGVVTSSLRKENIWLVFDGNIDENTFRKLIPHLNRTGGLVLITGEILKPPSSCKIIFETADSSQLSDEHTSLIHTIELPEGSLSWRSVMSKYLQLTVGSAPSMPSSPNYTRSSSTQRHFSSSATQKSQSGLSSPTNLRTSSRSQKLAAPESFSSTVFQRSLSSQSTGQGSWKSEYGRLLEIMSDWMIPPTLKFIKVECRTNGNQSEVSLVTGLFPLAYHLSEAAHEGATTAKERQKMSPQWIMAAFIFSLVTCLGASLQTQYRLHFGDFMRKLVYGEIPGNPVPPSVGPIGVPFPSEGSILDVNFDSKQRSLWKTWTDYTKKLDGQNITSESLRLENLLQILYLSKRPVLVVGEKSSAWRQVCKSVAYGKLNQEQNVAHVTVCNNMNIRAFKEQIRNELKGGEEKTSSLTVYLEEMQGTDSQDLQETIREALGEKKWSQGDIPLESTHWIIGASEWSRLDKRLLSQVTIVTALSHSTDSTTKTLTANLNTFLKNGGFIPDMFSIVGSIVGATISINKYYNHLLSNGKSPDLPENHYGYLSSLSTVNRVFQSIAMVEKEAMENKRVFARLWLHEMIREFADGLESTVSKEDFHKELLETTKMNFKDSIAVIFEKHANGDGSVDSNCLENLNWSYILDDTESEKEDERDKIGNDKADQEECSTDNLTTYHEGISEQAIWIRVLEKNLIKYNERNDVNLNIVITKYTAHHILRLVRILQRPSGHMLLFGKSGSGRRPYAKLAAFVCGFRYASLPLDKQSSFTLIRSVILDACIEGKNTLLYCGEAHLHHPELMYAIQTLMNIGPPHGVLLPHQIETLKQHWRLKEDNVKSEEHELWSGIQNATKENIHIVFASPEPEYSDSDAEICSMQSYPSLYFSFTRDYYWEWRREDLKELGLKVSQSWKISEELRIRMIECCIDVHLAMRKTKSCVSSDVISPWKYITLVKEMESTYTTLYYTLMEQYDYFNQGITTVQFAKDQISTLSDSLVKIAPEIEEAKHKADDLQEEMEKMRKGVVQFRSSLSLEESKLNDEKITVQNIQTECEEEVGKVLPKFISCVEKLGGLKPADVANIAATKTPSVPLKAVMAAVCLLLDVRIPKMKKQPNKTPDYWAISKRLLVDPNFVQQLQSLDPESVADTIIDKILKDHFNDIEAGTTGKIPPAAEFISKWVKELIQYKGVLKELAPKKESFMTLQEKLNEKNETLSSKMKQLKIKENELEELTNQMTSAIKRRDDLIALKDFTETLLDRDRHLYKALENREEEWKRKTYEAKKSLSLLSSVSILCSATKTYLTQLNFEDRLCFKIEVASILRSHQFDTEEHLDKIMWNTIDEFTIKDWMINALPNDIWAIESAVCALYCSRTALIIDRDEVCLRWLQKQYSKNSFVATVGMESLSCRTMAIREGARHKIRNCVSDGHVLLLTINGHGWENLVELKRLITKNYQIKEGIRKTCLWDNEVTVHENFKLFLITPFEVKLSGLSDVPAELKSSLTVVRFELSDVGIEEFLGQVFVWSECRHLDDTRIRVWKREKKLKEELKEQDWKLLGVLLEQKQDILKSEEKLSAVHKCVIKHSALMTKLRLCMREEFEMKEEQNIYKGISETAASLFKTITKQAIIQSNIVKMKLTDFTVALLTVAKDTFMGENKEEHLSKILANFSLHLIELCQMNYPRKEGSVAATMICLTYLRITKILEESKWEAWKNMLHKMAELDFRKHEYNKTEEMEKKLNILSEEGESFPELLEFLKELQSNPCDAIVPVETNANIPNEETDFKSHSIGTMKYGGRDRRSNYRMNFSKLPQTWIKLTEVQQLILVSILSPIQVCHFTPKLLKGTFGAAASAPDSLTMMSHIQKELQLPSHLNNTDWLKLPKRPLIVVLDRYRTCVVDDLAMMWQRVDAEELTVLTVTDTLTNHSERMDKVITSLEEGKVTVIRCMSPCQQTYISLNSIVRTQVTLSSKENEKKKRGRILIVTECKKIPEFLTCQCSTVWLEDELSFETVATLTARVAVQRTQSWRCVNKKTVLSLCLIHATLLTLSKLCPHYWTGETPTVTLTEFYAVMEWAKFFSTDEQESSDGSKFQQFVSDTIYGSRVAREDVSMVRTVVKRLLTVENDSEKTEKGYQMKLNFIINAFKFMFEDAEIWKLEDLPEMIQKFSPDTFDIFVTSDDGKLYNNLLIQEEQTRSSLLLTSIKDMT